MRVELSGAQIAGVALLVFSSILLGVGIHHMFVTGTCSSTGYSANYGPVPKCPAGTGWWFAFVFGGIIGGIAGSLIAGQTSLVFAGIFGAIGFGALSVLLDGHVSSGEGIFSGIFGGCFAIVGVAAGGSVLVSAFTSLRGSSSSRARPSRSSPSSPVPGASSAFGTPQAATAFTNLSADSSSDPIMGAYNESRQGMPSAVVPTPSQPRRAPSPTPINLVSGLVAAKQGAADRELSQLTRLAELHKQGALTDAEFASAKAKLLGQG